MNIGIIAPLRRNIPPFGHAGTERVIDALMHGLTARGHDITLFASGDSVSSGTLISTWPHEARGMDPGTYNLVVANHLLQIAEYEGTIDVWSNHINDVSLALTPLLPAPLVTTVHEKQTVEKEALFKNAQQYADFVAISHNQTTHFPKVAFAEVIYNGVNTDDLALGTGGGQYFSWLGWVSQIKGTADAARMARQAGVKLKIAGLISPTNQEYFDREVKPLLNDDIEYIGEVDGVDKVRFLQDSIGLLSPLHWPEPFGLVATEAMSCGTPVLTTNRGAMPELIVHGKTGYIVNESDDLIQYITRVAELDRKAIRQHVVDNFSNDIMIDNYEKLYSSIAERGKKHPK